LKAWAESLGGINYPLLSDFWPHGRVAHRYGVLRTEGFSERAIFVIDRRSTICFAKIYDLDEQPENAEVLEVLRDIDPDVALTAPKDEPVECIVHFGVRTAAGRAPGFWSIALNLPK
jgi:alkyl hydroperoxide reductase subunit AhpC